MMLQTCLCLLIASNLLLAQATAKQAENAAGTKQPAAAQQKPKPTDDREAQREALAAKVEKAHRKDTAPKKITTFKDAWLRIHPVDQDAHSIEVDFTADFISPRYLRYSIKEGGKVMQEGWDEDGAWSRVDGENETRSLEGKDTVQEREAIRQRRRLARQILEFLDPAQVIRSLKDISLVRSVPGYRVKRGKKIDCVHLEGTLDRYPLYFSGGTSDNRKVRLQIWIDAKRNELVTVQANVIGTDKKPITASGEQVRFPRAEFRNGILSPTILIFYQFQRGKRNFKAKIRVDIVDITLGAKLTKADLRRPSK